MKIAIMQPYFLPYLGYFQLINAVDKFVVLDDVNFINRGWVNRNNFLLNGKPFLMTIPLSAASQNKKINEILVSPEVKWKIKFLKTIELCYKKAPYFNLIFPQLEKITLEETLVTISELNMKLIHWILDYLSIKTNIVVTSSAYENAYLKGEERIIDICQKEDATTYVNPIGGGDLYTREHFQSKGIDLRFISTSIVPYTQISSNFVGNLSILDLIMNLDVTEICSQLNNYKLITK